MIEVYAVSKGGRRAKKPVATAVESAGMYRVTVPKGGTYEVVVKAEGKDRPTGPRKLRKGANYIES